MAGTLTANNQAVARLRLAVRSLWTYLPPVTLVALCAYALVTIVTRVFFISPGFDDSYYGSIARNIAEGRGYITTYGETVRTFNAEVTAGPAVLLPSALLQMVMGSQYWVHNLSIPLVSLPMVAAVGWLLHRRFGVSIMGLAVLAAVAIIFTNERTSDGDVYRFMFLWSHGMSDMPPILFTLLAALLVAVDDRRPTVHALAGLFLGLGLYSKVFIGLTLPGFAVLYAWSLWRGRDLRQVLAFSAGIAAVALFMEIYRFIELGSLGAYKQNTRDVISFYRNWPGPANDQSTPRSLVRQLSMTFGVFAVLAWMGFVAFDWARKRRLSAAEMRVLRLSVILVISGILHLFWWMVLNDAGWIRHAIPVLMYLAVAFTALAAHVRLPVTRLATIGVVGVLIVTQIGTINDYELVTEKEPRLEALLDASDYLNESKSESVSFWGCGWWANRDLDFVADVHFYDCLDSGSVWKHLDNGEQLLLVRSEFFNWEGSPVLASIAQDCDTRKLFAEGPFSVCDATPWLRANTPHPR